MSRSALRMISKRNPLRWYIERVVRRMKWKVDFSPMVRGLEEDNKESEG